MKNEVILSNSLQESDLDKLFNDEVLAVHVKKYVDSHISN